jgi:branched-chain amino acid transport system substrate-binding protein
MKKLVLALAATTFMSTAALAEDIKIGVFLGFTGPIESTVANMGPGAELAIKEVSDSGALLDGIQVEAVRGDTTCIDAAAATAAAERLITTDKVEGIVGGDCSGVTPVQPCRTWRVPNGIVMISPSATSPGCRPLKTTACFSAPHRRMRARVKSSRHPSWKRASKSVAITYTNNDYGKGLADSHPEELRSELGGKVTMVRCPRRRQG